MIYGLGLIGNGNGYLLMGNQYWGMGIGESAIMNIYRLFIG